MCDVSFASSRENITVGDTDQGDTDHGYPGLMPTPIGYDSSTAEYSCCAKHFYLMSDRNHLRET